MPLFNVAREQLVKSIVGVSIALAVPASALPPTESMIHSPVARAATVTVSGLLADCDQSDTTVGGIPTDFQRGFEGIDSREACHVTFHKSADPDLAVGLGYVVEVVNTAFAIYTDTGAMTQGSTRLGRLFADVAGCQQSVATAEDLFDPKVVYDERSDRFIAGALHIRGGESGIADSTYCMAVSQTGDPNGVWNVYVFPMDASAPGEVWLDRPNLGVGDQAIFVGGRLCDATPAAGAGCDTETDYLQGRAWAFERAPLYAGNPARFAEHALGTASALAAEMETPAPLDLHGVRQGSWRVGNDHYFVAWDRGVAEIGALRILQWTDPFGTSVVTSASSLNMDALTGTVAQLAIPLAPQAGSGDPDYIVGNALNPQAFDYRNGNAFIAQNVACAGPDYRSCLRWVEVDLPAGSVVQAGTIVPDPDPALAVGRVFPDLAATRCNELAMGYTRGTASSSPSAYLAYREPTDPAGTLQPERLLRVGDLPFEEALSLFSAEGDMSLGYPRPTSDGDMYHWGDYTGIATNPSGEVVWYVGEYAKNLDLTTPFGGWGTFIVATGSGLGLGNCAGGCSDGIDNDDDGLIDYGVAGDPGCRTGLDPSEREQCSDLLDNDGDGLVDFPADPQCSGALDHTESGCGLGFEVAVVAPMLMLWRRRIERASEARRA